MKKIEVIVRPDKLDGLKELLTEHKCQGMTVFYVLGCGRQMGFVSEMAIPGAKVNLIPKVYVMTVLEDEKLEEVLHDICAVIGTGTAGDGKVFVSNIEEVLRIRTGERGITAI